MSEQRTYPASDEPTGAATYRPLIGITMGEPAGIGPEVIVKALADPVVRARGRFIIYGSHELLSYAADAVEIRRAYADVFRTHVRRLRDGASRYGIEFHSLATQPEWDRVLAQLLHEREVRP